MSVFNDELNKNQRVVLENDLCFALLTNIPITPGHTLIIPKREVANFDELSIDEVVSMQAALAEIKRRLSTALGAEGFNFAWNQGQEYGQSVEHLHIHVVPRTKNDQGINRYEPRSFLYRPGSRATSPNEELIELCSLLKSVA